jgi:predicted RNase H-like nuclease
MPCKRRRIDHRQHLLGVSYAGSEEPMLALRHAVPPGSAVLGIDAAWTARHPSGVALIEATGSGWQCVAVAPSYSGFLSLARGESLDWTSAMAGSRPDAAALVAASHVQLGGRRPTVVAVDMPLSLQAITGRRPADNCISRVFGGRKCGTHSPSIERPGPLADELTRAFNILGFGLATTGTRAGTPDRLLEVYPHPALLSLLDAPERLKYKVGRTAAYWPGATPVERRANVVEVMQAVLNGLHAEISGIPLVLPEAASAVGLAPLKRFEDALDALVCAWIGARYLAGDAEAYGDSEAAIWVPGVHAVT